MSRQTLTDRYVHEVVRRIPRTRREDVAAELRTTIADSVDAHASPDPGRAERSVLTEMGDPRHLADRYTDRPASLIGPELLPTYLRLLTVLLATVLPVVVLALVVVDLLDGDGLFAAVGGGALALVVVGGQIIAWVTVVFALVERFGDHRSAARATAPWSPDDLPDRPEPTGPNGGAGWSAVSAAWHALLAGAIVWQHLARPYDADGTRVPVLEPGLWSGWMWPLLAGLAGISALHLVRIAAGGWRPRAVLWYAAAHALFALPLAWLLAENALVHEAFLTHVNGAEWTTPDGFWTASAVVVLVWSTFDVADRFRALRR